MFNNFQLSMLAAVGCILTVGAFRLGKRSGVRSFSTLQSRFTNPDQPARFAADKAANNPRVMDLESMYDPASLKGKTCLVTGGNRGIGLAIAKELLNIGAEVIITTRSPADVPGTTCISGVELTDNSCGTKVADAVNNMGKKIDVLINNAGYFYEPVESITDPTSPLNFDEEMKMIDICAVAPLRVTSGLFQKGCFSKGAKIAMITSQGGSIDWRTTQNPDGKDYGHHMSKAAANMMAVLVAQEFKKEGLCVGILHPGFNKTGMTKKYEKIWEIEGAVDASLGAKRVCHEIDLLTMERTGLFINCEDGLEIPW
jgi:NAD(P)-dependent dehydrogenase (short-subunit alcohol dehydrogenase family)